MPRKKQPGAPPPKSRSRKGCWPCKLRKVKCDEANNLEEKPDGLGPCDNCARLGQACDYRIRLNWDGRGKRVAEGVINFSSNSISVSTVLGPVSIAAASMTSRAVFQSSPPVPQTPVSLTKIHEPTKFPSIEFSSLQRSPTSRGASPDMTTIDPALTGFPVPTSRTFSESVYITTPGPPRYAQSYERHRNDCPSTPNSAALPIASRFRQVQAHDDFFSSLDSGAPSPATSTHSSFGASLQYSPVASPSQYMGREAGSEPDISSTPRSAKRRMYRRSQHGVAAFHPSIPSSVSPSSFLHQVDLQSATHSIGQAGSTSSPSTPILHPGDQSIRYQLAPLAPDTPDRRLSVNFFLSGPPGMPFQDHYSASGSNPEVYMDMYDDNVIYGVDRGIKDLDVPKNDDENALTGSSPVSKRAHLALVTSPSNLPEFGFGMEENDLAFELGGYYNKLVEVSIPRKLHPLPGMLLRNPMNLLYFHHFLNHTAGCLIPHNCASNPFRRILPVMAVQDENLMNLFLAYSACHRAKVLGQPEPSTRIALWVQDIFANLRKALDDPNQIITNANLATAIMLASLEIISPKAFGVTVPWQSHLDTARQMIWMRGGPKGMRTESRRDRVSSFLWSWFAYLDVLGSLSGGKNSPSSSWVLDYHVEGDTDYEIDCVLGFSSKCIRILAKIAALARVCDSERIRPDLEEEIDLISSDWIPSEDTASRAAQLEAELAESRLHPPIPCTHMQSSGEAAYQWDNVEMGATNEAFHWAGHVHLHRRILGKPSTHLDVQHAVREIFGALYKVRKGSNAEGCLLFPMFTAGCDSQDDKQRAEILDRMKGVERLGMTQVHRARTLMERVWETGKPWETLVAGEFFG